jgi:hypothetical protein
LHPTNSTTSFGLDHHSLVHHDESVDTAVIHQNATLAVLSSSSHGLEDGLMINPQETEQQVSLEEQNEKDHPCTSSMNQVTEELNQEEHSNALDNVYMEDAIISQSSEPIGNDLKQQQQQQQQQHQGSSSEQQSHSPLKDRSSTNPSPHVAPSNSSSLQDQGLMINGNGNGGVIYDPSKSLKMNQHTNQFQAMQQPKLYHDQTNAQPSMSTDLSPSHSMPGRESRALLPQVSSSSPSARDAPQGRGSQQQVQSMVPSPSSVQSSTQLQHQYHSVSSSQHPSQGGPMHPPHSMPPSHQHRPQHPMHNAPPQAGPPYSHGGQHHHYPGMMTHIPPHYYPQHHPGMSNGHPVPMKPQGMPPGAAPIPSRMSSGNSVSSSSRGPSRSHGQYSPSHGSTQSNWQSDNDMKHRREMIQRIVELLKKREGAASTEWLQKLPQMVKQLEVALYRSAPSFEAYVDKSTLKQRLQSLAKEISHKSNETKTRTTTNVKSKESMALPQNHMSMSSMNGLNQPPGPYTDPRYANYSRQPDAMTSNSLQRSVDNNKDTMSREQKERLRHKQERLLLLHHSSKCTNQDGTCRTPYCHEMKQLWTHMAKCENASCQVAHCYSSRTILSHYRKCRDRKCIVCAPVKSHIWREKKRADHASTQGHGSSVPTTPSSHVPVIAQSHPNHPPQAQLHENNAQLPPTVASNGTIPAPSSQFPGPPPYGYGAYPPPYGAVGPNYPPPYSQVPTTALKTPSNDLDVTKSIQSTSTNLSQTNKKVMSQDDSRSEMEKIRHKQQRLLLLRHASKCDAPEGTCEVTQHCSEMKKLWHHISGCQKNDCDVLHCLSSRYVLIHYRKCKDARCAACAPVRDAIKRGQQDKKRKLDPSPHQPVPQRSKISSVSPMPKRVKKEEVALVPSLINSLTTEQIDTHVKLLNREFKMSSKELKDKCMKVLRVLRDHEHGWVFNCPVDPVELGLPDYFDIIKNPMDLGTINKKLEKGEYTSVEGFDKDVRLTFDNAMLYNEMNSPVHTMAQTLMEIHCNLFKSMVADIRKEEDERRQNERACSLCGEEKRLFEPPVFFCSGMNCTNTRIRRQQFFYVSGHAQYNWCNSCYNELDEKLPIELPESQIYKRDLVKKKNNEEPEENWVACDDCERWVHQICGLFNARQNKDSDVKYSCPKCLLKRRKTGSAKQTERLPGAADLPKTVFSEWLENHVNKKIQWKFEKLALEKAQNEVSERSFILIYVSYIHFVILTFDFTF